MSWAAAGFKSRAEALANPLQIMVTAILYSDYVGRIAIGKILGGTARVGDNVFVIRHTDQKRVRAKMTKIFEFTGLGTRESIGPVSAAPYGSASILPISWAYIAMLGPKGVRRVSEIAILNANYIKSRLEAHFPVLYTRDNGRVAHELIFDLRPLKQASGIDETDVAKRLMDFGFHAPTEIGRAHV